MQLFELVSPRLFRPLAGPNRAFYAELLLLLWEECRHTADYSISRAEAVSRAEDYFAALAKPLALDADGAGDEDEQPTRDPHTLAVGFLLRLRRTGWLEEQPGSYETEPTLAFMPEVTPLLDALEEILNPRVVTYTGKLYKAWQLLGSIGQEKSPYENVLREVAADLETLNKSLRALNASIGHYIDRLTHNRTPQEVLELFDQYEEKVVAAAYHRFKTSDNLFNYRAYLEEELDDCEQNQLPRLALDYARVERCAPGEAAPRVRALIQQQRDALEEMSTLMKEIDASHIRYRKRAVQRAQFLLLSDRSAQGSVTALLRRYAEEIRSPEQLFEPDDGPVAARLHLYPAAVFGAKPLYRPAAPRTEAPLAPVRTEPLDPDRLRQEQQLLLDYARLAVTEENVALLARQALAARGQVNASTLVEEYPNDFTGIIGLHLFYGHQHFVRAGGKAFPLLQVQKPQHQQQNALVLEQPCLTALMLVDQRRRLHGRGVQKHRVAQRFEHRPHLVEVILNIQIFCPLFLYAAQHKAVVEQIVCGLFQQINGCHPCLPPCGGSGQNPETGSRRAPPSFRSW